MLCVWGWLAGIKIAFCIFYNLQVAVSSLAFVASTAFAETDSFDADLEASSEVPATLSDGHGTLDAKLDTSTRLLKWTITYEGLFGLAAAAHFHRPATVGKNAAIVVPISTDAGKDPIEGSATLTKEQVSELIAGQWYFNIHTAKYPSGEIRGQLAREQ
ncbi:CHRD domain-containing protein [Paraburkholderia humisilvae]|nr:CHRD domain-containing protein [Paraburkholderia humisilvae]